MLDTRPQTPYKHTLNLPLDAPAIKAYRGEIFLDEAQLAVELVACLPVGQTSGSIPKIDPDEFEKLYSWFLS